MAKGVTQSQWLNIIIIIISALVLAFMLMGKWMDGSTKQPNLEKQEIALNKIDFGRFQLLLKNKQNINTQLESKKTNNETLWVVQPSSALSNSDIKEIVLIWQQILSRPLQSTINIQQNNPLYLATVLLSFSNSKTPLVAQLIQIKFSGNSTKKITTIAKFVSTDQFVDISDLSIKIISANFRAKKNQPLKSNN